MKLHPIITELITDIDAFLAERDMNQTDFGKRSIGDPNLYRKLKAGRDLRISTLDRIRVFMAKRRRSTA
jgi:hypothetical protein